MITHGTHARHVVVLAQALEFRVVIVESILVSLVRRFPGPLLALWLASEDDVGAYPLPLHLLVTKLSCCLSRTARRRSGASACTGRRST